MKKQYDLIYSLGPSCACASYMNKNNLRTFSGPFDWLTYTSLVSRMDLILNEFKGFMEIEDFAPLEKDNSVINDCDWYENKKTGICFLHDFKEGISFEKSFPLVREKYERRIERFYEKIKSSERVLLIWFSLYDPTTDTVVKEKCTEVIQKLGKDIDFLIIEHDESKAKGEVEYIELSENITRAVLYAKGDVPVYGDFENCNLIFKTLELKMSAFERARRAFVKCSVKILCALIPSKRLRRKIRK